MSSDAKAVSAVDRHVGEQVRRQRLAAKLSQQALAAELGVTFQQVQKYENGTNRISAGRLRSIATLLGVSMESFYGDLTRADTAASQGAAAFYADPHARDLVAAWPDLPDDVRAQFAALARAIRASLAGPGAPVDGVGMDGSSSRLKERVASLTLR